MLERAGAVTIAGALAVMAMSVLASAGRAHRPLVTMRGAAVRVLSAAVRVLSDHRTAARVRLPRSVVPSPVMRALERVNRRVHPRQEQLREQRHGEADESGLAMGPEQVVAHYTKRRLLRIAVVPRLSL